ncbi:hypothetical protein SRHO_G00255310 [Serrasalmus rhombeus]
MTVYRCSTLSLRTNSKDPDSLLQGDTWMVLTELEYSLSGMKTHLEIQLLHTCNISLGSLTSYGRDSSLPNLQLERSTGLSRRRSALFCWAVL